VDDGVAGGVADRVAGRGTAGVLVLGAPAGVPDRCPSPRERSRARCGWAVDTLRKR
jgi:hypothetical protein